MDRKQTSAVQGYLNLRDSKWDHKAEKVQYKDLEELRNYERDESWMF